MITTATANFSLTRIFDAPRALVYQAFTEPSRLAEWWGPVGNLLPTDDMVFDVRPGGYLSWRELFPGQPGTWTHGRFDLTDVVDGQLLAGVMSITGNLPGGFKPFETKLRLEFHDEVDGRTRIEVRQWLPEHLVSPTNAGWGEAFGKLDAFLARGQAS